MLRKQQGTKHLVRSSSLSNAWTSALDSTITWKGSWALFFASRSLAISTDDLLAAEASRWDALQIPIMLGWWVYWKEWQLWRRRRQQNFRLKNRNNSILRSRWRLLPDSWSWRHWWKSRLRNSGPRHCFPIWRRSNSNVARWDLCAFGWSKRQSGWMDVLLLRRCGICAV